MFDSIGMASFRRKEEEQNGYKPGKNVTLKMDLKGLCFSLEIGSFVNL